eukprot:3322591-Lingulodinium_polyedra.AAC.1
MEGAALPRPDLPERWRVVAAELAEPGLPREVEGMPVRVTEHFVPGRPGYMRMVVRCGSHQGCYKHRNCSFNRTYGQREVL